MCFFRRMQIATQSVKCIHSTISSVCLLLNPKNSLDWDQPLNPEALRSRCVLQFHLAKMQILQCRFNGFITIQSQHSDLGPLFLFPEGSNRNSQLLNRSIDRRQAIDQKWIYRMASHHFNSDQSVLGDYFSSTLQVHNLGFDFIQFNVGFYQFLTYFQNLFNCFDDKLKTFQRKGILAMIADDFKMSFILAIL